MRWSDFGHRTLLSNGRQYKLLRTIVAGQPPSAPGRGFVRHSLRIRRLGVRVPPSAPPPPQVTALVPQWPGREFGRTPARRAWPGAGCCGTRRWQSRSLGCCSGEELLDSAPKAIRSRGQSGRGASGPAWYWLHRHQYRLWLRAFGGRGDAAGFIARAHTAPEPTRPNRPSRVA